MRSLIGKRAVCGVQRKNLPGFMEARERDSPNDGVRSIGLRTYPEREIGPRAHDRADWKLKTEQGLPSIRAFLHHEPSIEL